MVGSNATVRVGILGGGEEELNILSEFHRTPGVRIVGVYDRDPRAVALEIAEIVGVPAFSDESFLAAFREADYVVVSQKRSRFEEEITLLRAERKRILNPAEAASSLSTVAPAAAGAPETGRVPGEAPRQWPTHLDEALQYMNRITDRERLLKWLLEIAVRSASASSGSIMLFSSQTRELYIGYATGLSADIVEHTRQKLGQGIAGAVGQTREARLISEIVDTPLYRKGREREDIQSAISAPIAHHGLLLGVLNVSTNAGERPLTQAELATVKRVAEKIAPILNQHLLIDAHVVKEIEFQIRQHLESLFGNATGFHEKFTLLSRFLAERLCADTVTVYTATDEGDWLILGGSDQQIPLDAQSPRIRCNKGCLARAYVQGEEVILTEACVDAGIKLKTGDGTITSLYLPLVHDRPLGVLVLEFSRLADLQTFLRLKDALRFQVGFFTHSLIREIRQTRRLESLEELAALAPAFLALEDLPEKMRRLPELLARLVKASLASLHFEGPDRRESAYHNFPEDEAERRKRLEYDVEMLETVRERGEPVCLSYLTADVECIEKPPLYRSVIGFPIMRAGGTTVMFVGYDKCPSSPLDSSIFGEHEITLLRKAQEILAPLFARPAGKRRRPETTTFDDLLAANRRLMLDRIAEEIERAERYHHGFVLTVFRIEGLKRLFAADTTGAVGLINELSMGIRRQVRKTDFFSWMEPDLFAVLSIEGQQRMSFLENRIRDFLVMKLKERKLHDPATFHPANGYALFPGGSSTAADLVGEAIARIP